MFVTNVQTIRMPQSEVTSQSTAFVMLVPLAQTVELVRNVSQVHTKSPQETPYAVFAQITNIPPWLVLCPIAVKIVQHFRSPVKEATRKQTVSVRQDPLGRMVDHATCVFPALSSPNQEILCVNTAFLASIPPRLVQPRTAFA